ncbi:Gustatory receptor 26b [Halyomorpha halys]|nr:Gustatory receptor 26b [Halyomorpha halys]
MQDNTKQSSKTLKQTFQNMFRISAFCGVFPFVFIDSKLILSNMLLPYTITYLIFICCTMIYVLFHQFNYKSINLNSYASIISFTTPHLLPLLVPTVSVIWLCINLKKFSKIFRALKRVEDVTQNHDSFSYQKHYFSLFVFVVPIFVIEYTFSDAPPILIIFIGLMTMNAYLVMIQFTSILATIRNHFSFLEDSLYNSTAVEWTQCHEILGACCEIVNRCYSPQLFIFILSTFSYTTSTVYLLVVHIHFFNNDSILAMVWVIIDTLTVLVIVFHCQETVLKAKSFDKALYRLVLNDGTKQMLRNKRIRHHFKAKRKVEFSAMGFFNFDYSLIGRMVSTATTYIVIMVQFTP